MSDIDKAMNDLDKAMRDLSKVAADLVERTERLNRRIRALNELMGRRNRSDGASRNMRIRDVSKTPEVQDENRSILAQVREFLDNS